MFKVKNLFDLCLDFSYQEMITLFIKKENFIKANEIVQFLLENDDNYEFKNNILIKALPHLLENQQIDIKII